MDLLTTAEVAKILNLSPSFVRRLGGKSVLCRIDRVGKRDRFERSHVEKLRAAREMVDKGRHGQDGRWLPIHGEDGKRLYKIWDAMKRRGSRGKHTKKCYIGVTCCQEWQTFVPFAAWARANGYQDHLTLDRKDSSKGYEPSNCRWVTYTENNRNRRNVRLTIEIARAIRNEYAAGGVLQRELGEKYGCDASQVSEICAGRVWREE